MLHLLDSFGANGIGGQVVLFPWVVGENIVFLRLGRSEDQFVVLGAQCDGMIPPPFASGIS
ncbi:MAG: hypothetical protein KAR47_13565 [Planctomycetes bacterium]|nr:hypothetical protein [Planctomycetota bacterium]